MGIKPTTVSSGVVQVWPYDTLSPAPIFFTNATCADAVIAGFNPKSPSSGIGDNPYIAMPGRIMSK